MANQKLQCLVVEDDEDDFFLISHLLKSGVKDAQVERAATVDDALQRTAQNPYDVFLLDYRLGDKDGLELLRELKHRDVAAPVIFLTGQGDEEVAVQAMKAGAVDYLLKSKLNEPSLSMAVRYALSLRHKEEAIRAARRALYSSERRFRALVENSSDMILLLDAEATILYASQSVRRILAYSPAEMLETCGFDFVHPDDLPDLQQLFIVVRQAPQVPLAAEYRVRHKDGNWRLLEGTLMNRLQDSAVCAVVVNARDVTERRQAEQALRQSESEYRTLFENANDAILIFEPELEIILEANPKACEMYGFSHEELVGRSLKQIRQHGDSPPSIVDGGILGSTTDPRPSTDFEGSTIDHRPSTDFETVHRRKDGTLVYVLANASVIDFRGRQAILTHCRDISERKLAERERLLAEEELRQSESRYRHLVETANEGIWTIDAEDRTTFVNAKIAALLGYTPAEMLAHPVYEFLADFPRARQRLQQLRAGIPQQVDTVFRRKDGVEVFAILSATPIYDGNGLYAGALGMITDITARRALEQQLLQAQKMDAVGRLAGGIAHDFNNLLTVIISYAELLTDSVSVSASVSPSLAPASETATETRRKAEAILKAGRRAAALTQQLLAFSRKQVMSPRLLDLNSVLADFGRMLPRLIGEDIEVVLKPAAEVWSVRADPLQIEQVLMNLAVNARDAMPQGGRLTIETANLCLDAEYARLHPGVSPGEFVLIAVSDTGCGIPPEILPRIFEPFFTTKEQGKGTGLGLSTVYGIVNQSGGFLGAYSEPQQGTVFKVYLPRAHSDVEMAVTVADHRPTTDDRRPSETILIVEDEEAVRESASEFLVSRGYTVLQAKNGSEALHVLEHFTGTVHMLITDVIMPGMNGHQLASQVVQARSGIRVLYVSGYTESTVEQHGIDTVCEFLQKPFSLTALACKVREVLDSPKANAASA